MINYEISKNNGLVIGTIRVMQARDGYWMFRAAPWAYLDCTPVLAEIADFDRWCDALDHLLSAWNQKCQDYADEIREHIRDRVFDDPAAQADPLEAIYLDVMDTSLAAKVDAAQLHSGVRP